MTIFSVVYSKDGFRTHRMLIGTDQTAFIEFMICMCTSIIKDESPYEMKVDIIYDRDLPEELVKLYRKHGTLLERKE